MWWRTAALLTISMREVNSRDRGREGASANPATCFKKLARASNRCAGPACVRRASESERERERERCQPVRRAGTETTEFVSFVRLSFFLGLGRFVCRWPRAGGVHEHGLRRLPLSGADDSRAKKVERREPRVID